MSKKPRIIIEAWPQLIEALERHKVLGDTPEEVARFLIINGLDERERISAAYRLSRASAIAGGWRGNI